MDFGSRIFLIIILCNVYLDRAVEIKQLLYLLRNHAKQGTEKEIKRIWEAANCFIQAAVQRDGDKTIKEKELEEKDAV